MNKDDFWALIDLVNAEVPHNDHRAILQATEMALLQYSLEDILIWDLIRQKYMDVAYRNDLWAASAALGAHYSDDGFTDFRYWLISCGRQVYMDALQDPDSLANIDTTSEELNFERYGYVADETYTKKMPKNMKYEDRIYAMNNRQACYQLDPMIVSEIAKEIPQRPDIKVGWTKSSLLSIVPNICAKHRR